MARVKVVLNYAGFRELRTSGAAVDLVQQEAQAIAARAGDGFAVLPAESPSNRAHAVVGAVTNAAVRRNARDNALIRAVGA